MKESSKSKSNFAHAKKLKILHRNIYDYDSGTKPHLRLIYRYLIT
jgi:hypothetical protein